MFVWVGIAAQTSGERTTVPWSLWGAEATAQLMGSVLRQGFGGIFWPHCPGRATVGPGPGCCSPCLIVCGFPLQYGMVFDAGSSHTSLFVYQWDSDKENDTGVVSQTLSCDVQGQGISSYANNPPEAGNSLRECLDKALQVIPAEKQRDVPAYLGATAGMRLLREQEHSAAEQVLAEVAKTMQEYPVAFRGARILTGEEEGAYGWITINYLLDSFTKVGEGCNTHSLAADIFGALDLGGASTQITFMPEGSALIQNEGSELTLYGYRYRIYAHSYLCYGQDEMLKRLAKELIVVSSC
uniref:Ectonucleoside triphosphate diphosphohydrolase 8 n=1 Tax=Zonotrichia albicollis TaxID=44394 RepID=A0A8D2MY86_ZONAL